MKRLFTPLFVILLLFTVAGKAFGENPKNYSGKLDIKFIDFLGADFKFLYNSIEPFSKVSQIWKLQPDNNQGTENRKRAGTKPILTLGSIPEALLKYQSDAVLQWGYTLHDSILLLRIGVKAEDLKYIDFQPRRENNDLLNLHLNFNFLIDFWFK